MVRDEFFNLVEGVISGPRWSVFNFMVNAQYKPYFAMARTALEL